MNLTEIAKEKLGSDAVKMQIALKLGKSYITMRRWISASPVHSNLTKKTSIEAIKEFTGLEESEIFEPETIAYNSLSNN
jgi:hypothetical protein